MSGVRILMRFLPLRRQRVLRGLARSASRGASSSASGRRCSRRSTRAETCRRSAGRRPPGPRGSVDFRLTGLAPGRIEHGQQQIGLAMAGEAGKADDLALPGHEFASVRLPLGANPHPDRRGRLRPGAATASACASAPPMAATSLSRSKLAVAPLVTTRPSRITTTRSRVAKDFAQQVRDQDAADPASTRAA